MKSNQKAGRIIGFLMLLMMALGNPSVIFRGLSTTMASSPDFLEYIFENALQMRFSILLDVLTAAIWVVIGVKLFPWIKKLNHQLAMVYFGVWLIYAALIIGSNISHLSLLSLSQEFVANQPSDIGYYTLQGILKVEDYFWAHFFCIMCYSCASFIFYYFLFKTKLVPRFLSLWGMIAITIVFFACWLNIFDVSVSFNYFIQNGIHMIVLTGWLIAKGFAKNPINLNHSIA